MLKKLTFTILLIIGIWSSAMPKDAMAEEKPELVIYAYDSFASEWGPAPKIKAAFEKDCACTVTFIGLDSSVGILGRIRLEGAASKADIALGLDTSLTGQAQASGLFEEHGIDIQATALPPGLPSGIGGWNDSRFVPFDWGYFAFVYNKERVKNPPQSFRELIESDLRIVIQDPRTATPGTGLMLWVNAVYGDEAPAIWRALAPRIITVTKGWWDSYSMFLEGEADMVLSYSTSPAYHLIAEEDDGYAAAMFDDGHYTQVEVAGILKSSDNKELARAFLASLMSAEIQSLIPTTNWMYPVADVDLPDGFDDLIQPKAHLFPPEEVTQKRKIWVQAWLEGLSQ